MRTSVEVEMGWIDQHPGTVRSVAWGGALLFLLYGLVDWLVEPAALSRTTPWRFAGASISGLAAWFSASGRLRPYVPLMLAIGSPCNAVVVSILFLFILRDPMLVAAAQLQVLMCLGIVAVLRRCIWTTLPAVTLSLNVGLFYIEAGWQQVLLVNFLVGSAQLMLLAVSQQSHNTFRQALELEDRLRSEASFDFLTGLFNRRAFFEAGRRLWSACSRDLKPISTMLVDIDHFKRVNDSHGHEAGDRILQQMSRLIQEQVRAHDVVCRFGGEEFALLLPGAGLTEALQIAERVRQAVEFHPFEIPGNGLLHCSVSIGLVYSRPPLESLESALVLSDEAMYKSKQKGRNQVTHCAM